MTSFEDILTESNYGGVDVEPLTSLTKETYEIFVESLLMGSEALIKGGIEAKCKVHVIKGAKLIKKLFEDSFPRKTLKSYALLAEIVNNYNKSPKVTEDKYWERAKSESEKYLDVLKKELVYENLFSSNTN